MPIGFETGGPGGGGYPYVDAVRDAWNTTVTFLGDRFVDAWGAIWDWVHYVVDVAVWVLETIEIIYPVEWYQFTAAHDERMCPECGAVDGYQWEEGSSSGPRPPLHVNCRCQVTWAFTEWRTRYEQEWRLHWETDEWWSWEITGWL